MRSSVGYVRLYRSFLDWEWYDNDACVRVMLHLLLTVNWEPKKWHGQIVHPGQLITSMEGLSKTLGMTRTSVRRTFDRLKSSGEVTVQTNNHWTLVTLTNWAEYQGTDQPVSRPVSRPLTDQRPTTDRPAATTKEVKKERKKEEREQRVTAPPRMSFEIFKQACRDVHKKSAILSNEEAKAFFEYWTEGSATGKGRWQSQKVFDIALRMGTWKKRIKATDAPTVSAHLKDPNRKIIEGWQPLT